MEGLVTMFNNFFQGKRIFITGHTGFKGSWMLYWLHMAGAEIRGYALPPKPEHKLFGYINGDQICDSQFDDILNYPGLEKSILEFNPDFIFHLAAQALVRHSYEEPLETFRVNAIGTANVLNAMRNLERRCIAIIVTTDKVYQNQERDEPYREEERLSGYDPYSASKACAELIIESYRNSFFNPAEFTHHHKSIASVRAGNVIGGGDWAKDRIVPDIVRALQNREPVILRNPKAVRPWQHVLEPLHAYLLLARRLAETPDIVRTEYNFGPELTDCLPVEDMVRHAIQVWQSGTYQMQPQKDAPHEAGLLKLDISRARRDLDWKPVYNAPTAMQKTIQWYKSFDGNNATILLENDILEFMKLYERAVPSPV